MDEKRFENSQAAQARDVTLAFERLQRCDLQGFVWELYGFALRVIFSEYRESEDTHEKSIFLLFHQNIPLGELIQGKIV